MTNQAQGTGWNREIPDRRYRKPPVIEALCEVYFADSAWDDTVPGAFYERIKSDFPEKRRREIQQAEFSVGFNEARAGVRTLPPWMQFISDEKHRMIQIAQNFLVVNQSAPYPHFEDWEPEISRSISIYRELAQPQKIERLGLRYINRVEIPASMSKIAMEDYFAIYPQFPQALGSTCSSFLVRVEAPQIDRGHTVLITFASSTPQEQTPNVQVFMLDLYDIAQPNKPLDHLDFDEAIKKAHCNLVTAFENSITERLRALFELQGQP